MAIFGNDYPRDGTLSVDVPPFRVYVSRAFRPSDPTIDPIWGDFKLDNRVKVLELCKGSSLAGYSYARLAIDIGAPVTTDPDLRIEQVGALNHGDRVVIGNGTGTAINMLWAGYVVASHLNIAADGESLHYRLLGPEWFIGGGHGAGAGAAIAGQIRRLALTDDFWLTQRGGADPQPTKYIGTTLVDDERCVFNPDGHKNMGIDDCELNLPLGGDDPIHGKIWEIPERKYQGTDLSAYWTKLDALKSIWSTWNNPGATGIQNPDWFQVASVLKPSGVDQVLRSVDVDGLGLWEATKKILGPEFGCFIDPYPGDGNTPSWGPFFVTFFQRGVGSDADLVLNPLGTNMADATPSVVRLEATKDIGKVCNRVTVFAKRLRHVKLYYHGSDTPSLTADQKKVALQHGWTNADGKISDFAAGNEVERYTIEAKSTSFQDIWLDDLLTTGSQFELNKNIFRCFTWNEAGEFSATGSDGPSYDGGSTITKYWTPALDGIADGIGDFAGIYVRRRRPLLDTFYFDSDFDDWRRVRPTLYLAVKDSTLGPWVQVSRNHYRVDHDRGALWIMAPDLAEWRPFSGQPDPVENTVTDERTFGTLLYTGKLRMLLEGTVETDFAYDATADRQDTSGSVIVREAIVRKDRDFCVTNEFSDGVTSPSSMTGATRDDSADALKFAQQARSAGEDMQITSSIMVAPDWPEQGIGQMVNRITGRAIDLTGDGTNSRGCQIVALHCDCTEGLHWELLTESDALGLKRRGGRRYIPNEHVSKF